MYFPPIGVSGEIRPLQGAKAVEGNGSRVRFELSGVVATFHRPHPDKEAKPYQVRDARAFLEQAGVFP
ncbi:type II toxin-antitoxin system HicA family toxin [Pseudomonas sp. GM80]|uniref:type II toxin-antitoxin system HicA family toxin n=1 Tax=Pseudomonas sp. GM80 TaxID=1144339 RepID=UPI0009D9E2A9|nr:type II toxin-antitoxin system HicA family toxin [Pseudomonas sp. GM80]